MGLGEGYAGGQPPRLVQRRITEHKNVSPMDMLLLK